MSTKSVAGLIISAALILTPAAVSAQVATPQSTGKTATAQEASGKSGAVEEKKICKQLPSSSSRLPQRTCLTRKQWKQVEHEVND